MVYRHLLNFWPLVPSVDIQAVYYALKASENNDEIIENFDIPFDDFRNKCASIKDHVAGSLLKERINILIIGDGLGCLIKTISRMYRHQTLNVNIYVVSNFSECLTRNLLLLSLLTEPHPSIGVLEKAEMFLEIFGNTFIRSSTSEFVASKSADILDEIVSLSQPMLSVSTVFLSFLKQKEIDDICKIFSFLKSKESEFDISKAWENALRAYYGTRYDSRKNLFDYHYNLKLSQYPIINLRKYLAWCETGTAFKLRKGRYNSPNKTLCLKSLTTKAQSLDFYGDITTSPYITFGVECKREDMFEKVNNEYAHTSEDVSKFNMIDYMTEFKTNKACDDQKSLKVHFLFYSTFCKVKKFEKFFDAIYITCDMTSYAENNSLEKGLDDNGVVIFETVNNVVNSTKEHKKKHVEDIENLAERNNLQSAKTLKRFTDNFRIFVKV